MEYSLMHKYNSHLIVQHYLENLCHSELQGGSK